MNILCVPSSCHKLLEVRYQRSKGGEAQLFYYDEDSLVLYEVIRYLDKFKSWFLDNSYCKEGHLDILTKIDPLFIFLPQIIKYASEKFRSLHDICSEFSSNAPEGIAKLEYALSPDINWELICDTREVDQELYVKFSENRTLDWLLAKHAGAKHTLISEFGPQTSEATLNSYATDLIDEYLPSSLDRKFKEKAREKSLLASSSNKPPEPKVADRTVGNNPSVKRSNAPVPSKPPQSSVLNFFKKVDRS